MAWTLVTGGAKGLGREIALALASQGRDLIIHYRTSEQTAKELIQELHQKGVKAETIQGEFSSLETTQEFTSRYLKQFPDTQSIVYNVGNFARGSALNTPPQELQALLQTNLLAALSLIQALTPSIIRHKGEILTIGMVACSKFRASTYAFGYDLTKTALWLLTHSLAKELAAHKVRVNMVSPGYLEESVDLPKEIDSLPMGRLASFSEVARAVSFLMDPASAYITGQNLEIAGGIRL